ncbi:MAG: SusC/RagA family TonB-linked outer membrane protein [Bacteroidota bacterium]
MRRKLTLSLCFLFFLSSSVMAQQTVTGKIIDPDGEPMIGVNILELGTSNGTITDFDGNYSIEVAGPDAVLEFTYTGYSATEQTVGTQTTINLTLREDVAVLEQVVVSALGFKENKDELGSTASIVQTEDIVRSGEATFLNSLGAKASNVQISRANGDPGAGTTIRIRGANSISGSSNPLIILDGIPISNSSIYGAGSSRSGGVSQQSRLNDLNPNDIESVQILKGASAAALWGSRAANGVLVITTKDGKAGKVKIDYTSTVSFDVVQERYDLQTTWGQGRSGVYGPTRAESWGDYIPDRSGGADVVATGPGQFYSSSSLDEDDDIYDGFFTAADGTQYNPIPSGRFWDANGNRLDVNGGKNSRETFVDRNWNQAFQTGGFVQHDLAISGGGEKTSFFFSLGRIDQEGIIRGSSYDRTNIRLNSKSLLADWLTVSTKGGFTNSYSNRIQQNSNTGGLLLGLLRTPPDFDNSDYIGNFTSDNGAITPLRHRSYRRYLGNSDNPIYNNPAWTVFEQTSDTRVNRYTFSADMDINPTSTTTIKLRGGVDGFDDRRVYFFPIGSASRVAGLLEEESISRLETNFDAIIRNNFTINSDISFQATLGWNYNDRRIKRLSSLVQGFLANVRKPTSDLNADAAASQYENSRTNIRSNRGYAVLNFDLYDRLYVNLTGALEASSTVMGTFFYPSADVAYQLINPGNSIGILDFAKIRASYGRVGIQAPAHRWETLAEGGFTYSSYSDPLQIALFGGGFRLDDDKGNPDLEPEIKTEFEIGADLRLFNEKLSLGMTYYQNKITGMIIDVDLTPSSGFDTQTLNAAEMENKGFELEADYSLLKKGDWDIGAFLNFGLNRNEVLDLRGTETINLTPGASVSSRAIVGEQLGVLFGTSSQMDERGNLILNEDGFPQLTNRPVVLGDPNPDWRGGLGIRLKWKGLFANAIIEHSQGGDFSPRTLWVLRRFGTTNETANRITLDQDLVNFAGNTIAAGTTVRGNIEDFGAGPVLLDETWYRTGIGGGFGDNQAYNFSIFDATFTRFRELSLGYVFNGQKLRDATKLGSITVTLTGRNLFLIDDIPGIDPEVNQFGVSNGFGLDYFTNPSTRSYLFSVKISY